MKKRLLALLLIVCFVVAIPCQASAANNTTSSDNNEQEIEVQQKEEVEVASTSAASTITMHYPGEEITAPNDSKDDGWTEDSLGYRAYMYTSEGIKYGFVTCGHSIRYSEDGYVYAKDKATKIGVIYSDEEYGDMDFSFVALLPGHEVSDYTKYGGVKLTGIGTPEVGMKVFHEGMATQKTESVVCDTPFYTSGSLKFYAENGDNGFVKPHDSGGIAYNKAGQVLGHLITGGLFAGFFRAEKLEELQGIYVAHGKNTINLTISNSVLSWNRLDGVGEYYVYYRYGSSGSYDLLGSTQGTTYDVNSLGSGYEYIVYCSSGNVTSVSNSVKNGKKYTKPKGVFVTNDPDTNTPKITWDHVEGASTYEIWSCTDDDSTYKLTGMASENYYLHSDAKKGLVYYYKVKVSNGKGSDYSSEVRTVCGYNAPEVKPENDPSTGKPKLSWKRIDKATQYEVWYSKQRNGTYEKLISTSDTSYIHTATENQIGYYYKIRALLGNNIYTEYSDIKKIICSPALPTINVEIDEVTGKPRLSWNDVGADLHIIYFWDSKLAMDNGEEPRQLDYDYESEYDNAGFCAHVHEEAELGKDYYYVINPDGYFMDYDKYPVHFAYRFHEPYISTRSDSNGKPVISWEKVPFADEYIVEVSTTGREGDFTELARISENTYTHTDAEVGEIYYYRVCAYRDAERDCYTHYSYVSRIPCLQGQPSLTITNTSLTGKPMLKWSAVPNAGYYNVYYSTTENGLYRMLHHTSATSFFHTAAVADTTYYYYVVANNSACSDKIKNTCKYPQPKLTVGSDTTTGKPVLRWTQIAGAGLYEITYATSPNGTYRKLACSSKDKYTHNNATPGVTYYYKVKVSVGAGSEYSSIGTALCKLAKPVVTVSSKSNKPIISWKSVSGAHYYILYYSTTQNGTYKTLGTTSGLSYMHTYAAAGSYYYKVRAYTNENSAATSAYSKEVSVKSLSGAAISAISAYTYSGSECEPTPTVTLEGKTLIRNKDYTLSYSNNKNAGTATVKVTGIGIYKDAAKKTFTIKPKSLSGATIGTIAAQTYTGSAIKPTPTVTLGEKTLVNGTDYYFEYSNNTSVTDSARITVIGKGNYTSSTTTYFKIVPKTADSITVTGVNTSYTYTGQSIRPSVTVKDGTKTLVNGTHYTVSYGDNLNVGTGNVKITFKNGYTGEKSYTFGILSRSLSGATIGTIAAQTYTGSAIKPTPTVTLGGKTLVNGTDYYSEYSNNTSVTDSARITVIGKGNYTGSKTIYFKITAKDIKDLKVTAGDSRYTYTGDFIKPTVTVKYGSTTLTNGTHYTVTYSNNKNVGTAKIVITGKGNYKGTRSYTFGIVPKAPAGLTVSSDSLFVNKIYWNKVDGATGYKIWRRVGSSGEFTEYDTIDSNKDTVIYYYDGYVNPGNTYYYYVKAYQKVGNDTLTSDASETKSIKK